MTRVKDIEGFSNSKPQDQLITSMKPRLESTLNCQVPVPIVNPKGGQKDIWLDCQNTGSYEAINCAMSKYWRLLDKNIYVRKV